MQQALFVLVVPGYVKRILTAFSNYTKLIIKPLAVLIFDSLFF